jgi:prevent-host-death family protein
MAKIPEIIPISELRQDAASVLNRVQNSDEPIIVTQRGRAAAVMLSIKAFERADHERRLLNELLRGEKEIAIGEGHDIDAVLAEADSLLNGDQP